MNQFLLRTVVVIFLVLHLIVLHVIVFLKLYRIQLFGYPAASVSNKLSSLSSVQSLYLEIKTGLLSNCILIMYGP